jgi:hypothetical protein
MYKIMVGSSNSLPLRIFSVAEFMAGSSNSLPLHMFTVCGPLLTNVIINHATTLKAVKKHPSIKVLDCDMNTKVTAVGKEALRAAFAHRSRHDEL